MRVAFFCALALCLAAITPGSSVYAKAAEKSVTQSDTLKDTTAPTPVVDDTPIDPSKKDKAQDKGTKGSPQKSKK